MMALCAPIDLNYSKLNYTAMKHFNLLKSLLLLCALIVGSLSGWADEKELTFVVSSNPGGWPTTNPTTLTNYSYTLDYVDYTFALKNVKCNNGYLMFTNPAVLGLPAIDGYKLTKVELRIQAVVQPQQR